MAVGAKAVEKLVGAVIAKRKETPVNPMLKKNHTLYIDAVYVPAAPRRRGAGPAPAAPAAKTTCSEVDLDIMADE